MIKNEKRGITQQNKLMSQEKIAYLQMLQQTISRMASNSFRIKGWWITSISALYGFWITNFSKLGSTNAVFLTLIITVNFMFHYQDAYYLRMEKGFRKKYEQVIKNDSSEFFVIEPILLDKMNKVMITAPLLLFSYGVVYLVTTSIQIVLTLLIAFK